MRTNISWPYKRQFSSKREGLKPLLKVEKSLSGRNREIEDAAWTEYDESAISSPQL